MTRWVKKYFAATRENPCKTLRCSVIPSLLNRQRSIHGIRGQLKPWILNQRIPGHTCVWNWPTYTLMPVSPMHRPEPVPMQPGETQPSPQTCHLPTCHLPTCKPVTCPQTSQPLALLFSATQSWLLPPAELGTHHPAMHLNMMHPQKFGARAARAGCGASSLRWCSGAAGRR